MAGIVGVIGGVDSRGFSRSLRSLARRPGLENRGLLLTGGYDSQTLHAGKALAGKAPGRANSWGMDDAVPASDPFLAKRVAAQFDVPFAFLRYDHHTVHDRAAAWAFVYELGSDNLGNFAVGPDALYELGDPAPAVWTCDQMLGTGGVPSGFEDAVEVATGLPMGGRPPGLEGLVKPSLRAEVAHRMRAGVLGLVGPRAQEPPKDVQDYHGWHVRVGRWHNAPTYCREPMVSTGRPMLHAPVVDLFTRLPTDQRVDKRLLAPMRRTAAPTSRVVQFWRAMARWGFTTAVSRAAQRSARWALGRRTGASSGRVIQRVALLNLLLRTIDEGGFASGNTWQQPDGGVPGHATWAVRSLANGHTDVAARQDPGA